MLWDIFCRVIDNHGDLGVCWRFAAGLAERVTLAGELAPAQLAAAYRDADLFAQACSVEQTTWGRERGYA